MTRHTWLTDRPLATGRPLRVLVYLTQMEVMGGIESHVVEFCLHLAAAGHRLTLLCSRYAPHADVETRLRQARVELRINRPGFASRSPVRRWVWTLIALLGLTRRRFDAIYTNGQGRNPALVQAWYRGRVRCVHHHHTSCDEGDVATWPAGYRAAMRRSDVLVVCAEFIRPRIRHALGNCGAEVVHCFSRSVEVANGCAPEDCVTFGYFGRLIREKGIEHIFRLSHDPRLGGIRWCVWGGNAIYGPPEFAAHPNVEYAGAFFDESGLQRALERLDCFCLFSTHPEGLPISLLEVMSAGRPWIATPQGGIPELAHDPASCVLVDLDDYEGIVAACAAMRNRIVTGVVDHARQRSFYAERFGPQMLLRRWLAVLAGPSPR
jgi:glycosyltransferase involved in cell wall biosynthesis